jgi:hypothetical protein
LLRFISTSSLSLCQIKRGNKTSLNEKNTVAEYIVKWPKSPPRAMPLFYTSVNSLTKYVIERGKKIRKKKSPKTKK